MVGSCDSSLVLADCLLEPWHYLEWLLLGDKVYENYSDLLGSCCVVAEGTYKHNNYTQYKATTNTRLTCRVSRFQELTNWRPLRRGRGQRPSCESHFQEYEFIQDPYGYSLHSPPLSFQEVYLPEFHSIQGKISQVLNIIQLGYTERWILTT